IEASGVACEVRTADGRPADEILRVAREVGAGLIVLGHHQPPAENASGAERLRHRWLGSTPARVVRESSCPVLVAEAEAAEPGAGRGFASEGPWLVAMDFSEPARAALK